MVKTIEYSAGVTPVDFSQAHPYGTSNRYYAVRNYGDSDIFISASESCAEGVDGSKRVPAGECRGIDMQGLNVLFISAQGAGTAEIDTAAGISALGFNGGSKGGGSSGGVVTASGNPVQLGGLQGGVPFNRVEVSGKNLLLGIVNLYPTTNGNLVANSNAISVYAKCNPNTTYTIQRNGGSRLQCAATQALPSNGTTFSNLIVVADQTASTITYTTPDNCNYIVVYLTGSLEEVTDIQIEEGSTPTAYEPPITGRELTLNINGTEIAVTPDSNPYTVPIDIIQQDGLNVLSIADDSNPTISVSGNKASEQLGMIFRTLDNKPILLFDGTIPTSSSAGYAEFDLVKNCSILIIVPTLNDTTTSGTTYAAGNCTVLPVDYAREEEREFTLYGNPKGTQSVSRGYIKRTGNTFSVRGSSTACAYLTIYGI